MAPVRPHITEAVAPYTRAAVDDATLTDSRPGTHRCMRVDHRSGPDVRASAHECVRTDTDALTQFRGLLDHHEGADPDIRRDLGGGVHVRRRMNTSGAPALWIQGREKIRQSAVRVPHDYRAPPRGNVVSQRLRHEDQAGAGVPKIGEVLDRRNKRKRIRLRTV